MLVLFVGCFVAVPRFMMSIETVILEGRELGASIKLFILVVSEVLGFGARRLGPFILSSCMRLGGSSLLLSAAL